MCHEILLYCFYSRTIPFTMTSEMAAGDFSEKRIRTKRAFTDPFLKDNKTYCSLLVVFCLSDTVSHCCLSSEISTV